MTGRSRRRLSTALFSSILDEDDHEAALDACTRAIAMHPDDASFELMVIEKRANVYMLIENYEQALSEYELLLVRNLDRDSSGEIYRREPG